MLVTLKEILGLAEAYKCAVGSFNTPNLESIMAVIQAAEELDVPVIIQHAQVHESFMPISIIGPIMIDFAKRAKIPVCVHLDHGETLSYIYRALKMGFTSVMYDGSLLPFEENVINTQLAVHMAQMTGASVEGEIGSMGRRETGIQEDSEPESDPAKIYTDPDQAKQFVEKTGIDALACSFGTSHGIYLKEPKLDMNVLDRVNRNVKIPLVMHGGSGVSEADYKIAISKGIRKVNYYTYMAKAGGSSITSGLHLDYTEMDYKGKEYGLVYKLMLKEKIKPVLFHDIVNWGVRAMKDDAKHAMEIFAMGRIGEM